MRRYHVTMTLREELAERAARGWANLPPERRAMYERAAAALDASGVAMRALGVGDVAPDFELPAQGYRTRVFKASRETAVVGAKLHDANLRVARRETHPRPVAERLGSLRPHCRGMRPSIVCATRIG